MKEIGESFKEAREAIGISKEEVVKDLNITESQLDNLEDGNINAFKDVFFLKDTIKKYSKYLNLEQTREIHIAKKEDDENKIVSPYTVTKKRSNAKYYII